MDKKKIRNDIILIASLLAVTLSTLFVIIFTTKKTNLIAKIYVQNDVVETIDLSQKKDEDFLIHGINGDVKVHTHDGAIAIIESNCPHQDCVSMGYIKQSNRPIICAYNAVSIVISGSSTYDAEIG